MTTDAMAALTRGSVIKPSATVVTTVASAGGVRRLETAGELRALVAAGKLCWIDITGGDAAARAALLGETGLGAADLAWVQRFGQMARLTVGRQQLRAATWVSDRAGNIAEIHLLCMGNLLLTVWGGDTRLLDEARITFAERAGGLESSPYQAAGIVLQLLLGTLDLAITELDAKLQYLRVQLDAHPGSIDFSKVAAVLQKARSAWSDLDRYTSTARSAMVGVEVLPGIDERAAAELNDYAEQVEDVAHRLHERSQWGAQIVQDYVNMLARHQGAQINRLTVVSVIFLPLTFMTGFFGMNFNWMINSLSSPWAFILFGIVLPVANVIVVFGWLRRKGLM